MKKQNPFLMPLDHYQRDLNFMRHYIDQNALYLSKMRGISIDQAKEFITKNLGPEGKASFKDVAIEHTFRGENGDREVRQGFLYDYIQNAVRNKFVIAPTLTCYTNAEEYETPLVASIDYNVAQRNKNKAEMFQAIVAGNVNLARFKDSEQTGNKLSNNAVSGGHVTPSTPIFNKSAHSSLTSTCRITAAFANASNERIVAGNRHYYNVDVTMANILSIVNKTDSAKFKEMIDKYGLHYPSVDEVMDMIDSCARQYWSSAQGTQSILDLVSKLNDVERAAVLYTGDLYHVLKYNEAFMRSFIDQLVTKVEVEHQDPESVFKSVDGDYISLAYMLQGEEAVELARNNKALRDMKGESIYARTASTVENIYNTLEEYDDFIKLILVSDNLPATVADFTTSIRHSVIAGDTDSTIFTVQEWVKWYRGDYILDEKGMAVYVAIVFLASQAIVHTLAQMSANIGVRRSRLLDITMKNEYRFDAFVPTNAGKHYYAGIGAREGNVFAKMKYERKGVHLISSAAPKSIIDAAARSMESIIDRVVAGEKISMIEEIHKLQSLELSILRAIKRGEHGYFRYNQIKQAESYKQDATRSPYSHYTLWEEVFAPKYGSTQPPPYSSLKINTVLKTDRHFEDWLDGLEDKQLADRFRQWCSKNSRTRVVTFYLPESVIQSSGVPDEIFEVMDKRRIILDNSRVFYMILETLSFFMVDEKINRLSIDYPVSTLASSILEPSIN